MTAPADDHGAADWKQQPAPAAWAPPPKPGLIPLRPLSFGTILGSSFRVMRRNPGPTFGLSVILFGGIMLVYGLLVGGFFAFAANRISSASIDDQNAIMAGAFGLFFLLSLVPIGLAIAATGVVQGILSLEVSRATLGERLKLRGLWRLARGRIGTLVLWAMLTTAVLVAFVVLIFLIMIGVSAAIAVASVAGSDSYSTGSMMGATFLSFGAIMVVGLGFIVLSAWLGIKTALVPSVIVLERLGLFASIARSWRMTRGNFWRTFGIWILIYFMVSFASNIAAAPLQIVSLIIPSLINPVGDPTAGIVIVIVIGVVSILVSIVVGAIGLVIQSSALALVYIDIRMRKEGLDLELLHYVEAKRRAEPGVANPYERLTHPLSTTQPQSMTSSQPATGSPWA